MTKETPLDDPRQKTDQQLKPGPQMDELSRKIRQLETALHINEWLPSGTSTARTSSRKK
jgi:hypothetical protein